MLPRFCKTVWLFLALGLLCPAPAGAGGFPPGYGQALAQWKNAADISRFIGANFRYDQSRALALSETGRRQKPAPAIITPEEFYKKPRGICLDLARFGVSALRRISPASRADYLMVEFEPLTVNGQVFRRHWLAVFRGEGGLYIFADSKRPGHIAGPHADLAALARAYQEFRGRRVVRLAVLSGFRKKRAAKKAARKTRATPGGALVPE